MKRALYAVCYLLFLSSINNGASEANFSSPKMFIQSKQDDYINYKELKEARNIFATQFTVPDWSALPAESIAQLLKDRTDVSIPQQFPIKYTQIYEKRGIFLTAPHAGYTLTGNYFSIAGTIQRKALQARDTEYLIVQTKKNKDEATYFIPVKNFSFAQNIPLRFGSGTYRILLSVPEITQIKRNYFRFFSVAEFHMKSLHAKDSRNLLPSRGIESDHPIIKSLAAKIVKNEQRDIEKALAIYAYISKNFSYDVTKWKLSQFHWSDSALKFLSQRKGVCQDFSYLTIALLRSLKIPARFVEGETQGQRHAWVEVKLADRWLTMDPTWGAGYIKLNRFVQKYDARYFDPTPDFFKLTHKKLGVVY